MPAYNAGRTLERTYREVPLDVVDEVLVIDDASHDDTVAVARRLGLAVYVHPENRGYGGNQSTCYDEALKRNPDAVIMIHPDYQYDSRLIPHFLGFMEKGTCDVMLGNRIRTRREALEGGMPVYKYISNRFLTIIENLMMGQNLGDFHSGFRVYTREVLETIDYRRNSDDFVFDTQFLAQAAFLGFKLGDAPIPVRYFPEASSIKLWRSIKYGLCTLGVVAKYFLQRIGLARFSLFKPKNPSPKTNESNCC
ncbi:MAG: glycosyltransferase family 2 protein [Planctomycetes bacterium]|nr:glycosyltransferase family 2 protein [Planctomycetota bacterium]